jgi:putative ABC transport system substrate-binding protein
MHFRSLFAAIVLLLAPLSVDAGAQTAGKTYRVGYVAIGPKDGTAMKAGLEGLTRGLARHGFVVGSNLVIEARFAEAKPERLPGLVKELIDAKVDVVMAFSYPAARAAKDATKTIPIVIDGASDPVGTGLVASLSRPGGNVTGLSDMAVELSAKRLALLRELVPGAKKVAVLFNASDPAMTARYHAAETVAPALGITLQPLGVREPEEFDTAFEAMKDDLPDGIMMVTDALTNLNRKRVFEFAADHHLPAIFELGYMVHEGGLMAYGVDRAEASERAADIVVRLLNGANPADLPIEQPTRFHLTVNPAVAKNLGLTFPQSILIQADEVVE